MRFVVVGLNLSRRDYTVTYEALPVPANRDVVYEHRRKSEPDTTVYNADINSAYPYAATLLPNLATGQWLHFRNPDRSAIRPTAFALYHIQYRKLNPQRSGLCLEPQPLFRRYSDDRVMWPNSVTGWYWAPEAFNVRDNPHAEFLESWEYVDDGTRPFAFLQEMYDRRLQMQRIGDAMELAFKLGPNSVYGQCAQRAGWKHYKGPPTFHQIEWAGFMTSVCRAMVYIAAMGAWNNNGLIAIDTDGIYATAPIPESVLVNGVGNKLGQWKVSTLPGIFYWQSGVYWIPCEKSDEFPDGWKLKKARGAPKGKIPFSSGWRAFQTLAEIKYKRNELIGYRWALRNDMSVWRYFVEKDRSLQFGGSEFSKRFHNPRGCRLCRGFRGGHLHDLAPATNGMAFDNHSKMHVLPWEKNDHERERDPIDLKTDLLVDEIWAEEP